MTDPIRYIVVLERRITSNCVEIESTLEVTVGTGAYQDDTEEDRLRRVREYCDWRYDGWAVIDSVREDHICG